MDRSGPVAQAKPGLDESRVVGTTPSIPAEHKLLTLQYSANITGMQPSREK